MQNEHKMHLAISLLSKLQKQNWAPSSITDIILIITNELNASGYKQIIKSPHITGWFADGIFYGVIGEEDIIADQHLQNSYPLTTQLLLYGICQLEPTIIHKAIPLSLGCLCATINSPVVIKFQLSDSTTYCYNTFSDIWNYIKPEFRGQTLIEYPKIVNKKVINAVIHILSRMIPVSNLRYSTHNCKELLAVMEVIDYFH